MAKLGLHLPGDGGSSGPALPPELLFALRLGAFARAFWCDQRNTPNGTAHEI